MVGDVRESFGLFSNGGFKVETSLFIEGDFALLADSTNQCLMEASWFMKGFREVRRPDRLFNRPLGGASDSGF